MSNYPPPGMPQTAYPQPGYPPPQPSGCGCGGCLGKFFILLGVAFFLMLAVCCGGVFYMRSYLKKSITQQPNEVQAVSDEITAIKVPPPLAPAFGGRFNVPFSGTFLGEGAVYAAPNRKSVVILASFSDTFGPQFKDQLVKGLEAGPSENKSAGDDESHETLKDVKKSQIERTIRGEKAIFNVSQGVGVKSGVKKIQVQGEFQGKTGPTLLIIAGEEATLSRDKVDDIIQSIDAGEGEDKK
jgi:hypothetical protein